MEKKQPNKLEYSYSSAFKTILPKLNFRTDEGNSDFPSRCNFHYKRAFSKFVTNKFTKENYLPKIVDLSLNFTTNKKQPDHPVLRFPEELRSESENNWRLKKEKETSQEFVDTFENKEKKIHTHIIDLRKFSPSTGRVPIKRKEFKQSKVKIKKSKSVQLRERPKYPSPKPQSQQEQSDELEEEELKKIYCPTPLKPPNSNSKLKHVIDLNFVSANSRLSEHFLRPYSNNLEQTECSLSDMNLNEMWPNSTMAKQATKTSPWINTFKAKSIANEINRNYCESSMDPSRTDYVNFLPNLKTPEINSAANSRLENNTSTTKKYSFFLPDIKISYCQKQIL